MAWTTPKTWVAGAALTAAELNIYLRDNMLEQAVARATTAGSYFTVVGPNLIRERKMKGAAVTAAESTTSSSYRDLNTPGPSVTITTGTMAAVFLQFQGSSSLQNVSQRMSFEVSGATEIEPIDNMSVCIMINTAGANQQWGACYTLTNLTAGSNTFTAKYRSGIEASSATFQVRRLSVLPLN